MALDRYNNILAAKLQHEQNRARQKREDYRMDEAARFKDTAQIQSAFGNILKGHQYQMQAREALDAQELKLAQEKHKQQLVRQQEFREQQRLQMEKLREDRKWALEQQQKADIAAGKDLTTLEKTGIETAGEETVANIQAAARRYEARQRRTGSRSIADSLDVRNATTMRKELQGQVSKAIDVRTSFLNQMRNAPIERQLLYGGEKSFKDTRTRLKEELQQLVRLRSEINKSPVTAGNARSVIDTYGQFSERFSDTLAGVNLPETQALSFTSAQGANPISPPGGGRTETVFNPDQQTQGEYIPEDQMNEYLFYK